MKKDSFHDDFLKFFLKSTKDHSDFFLKFGLAEIQPRLVLNLFLMSDENPG